MIRRLAPHTVQQIAAGEVVERPASALKELIENSLDAGASQIRVTIDQGGLGLLEVDDNGVGIETTDLELVFEPHATSKLSAIEDLLSLTSYGFRGEALSSLAAVADVTLWTQNRGESLARKVKAHYGRIEDPIVADARVGTCMTIRGLFAQVPARLKFMKSLRAETLAMKGLYYKYVLAHPEIHWSWVEGSKKEIYPPCSESERVAWYFDSNDFEYWMPFNQSEGPWTLKGALLRPSKFGTCRSGIEIFYAGRPIKDIKLEFTLRRALEGFSDQPRLVTAVLFISSQHEWVDVNIHPRKTEVQFKDFDRLSSFIYRTLRRELEVSHKEVISTQEIRARDVAIDTGFAKAQVQLSDSGSTNILAIFRPETQRAEQKKDFSEQTTAHLAQTNLSQTNLSQMNLSLPLPFSYLGSVDDTYLITKSDKGLVLFDQHALHERILYERLLETFSKDSKLNSQRLLFPLTIQIPNVELLMEHETLLEQLGFELRLRDGGRVQLVAAPALVKRNHSAILERLLESIHNPKETVIRDVLATMACHSAVRAHDILSRAEIEQLLRDFGSSDALGHCPHGRPTYVNLSLLELEKLFHRVLV